MNGVLVHAIDGMGMGHLNRCLVLARALRAAAPQAAIDFAVDSPAFPLVAGDGFPVIKLADRSHPLGFHHARTRRETALPGLFAELFEALRPEAFVVDFLCRRALFEEARRRGIRVAVVLRRQRPAFLRMLALDPGARLVDRWLLPHTEAELPLAALPRSFRARALHLGKVRRSMDPERMGAVRGRYAGPGERLVVVTVGGGGAAESLSTLHAAAAALDLLPAPRPQFVLLYGPYHVGTLPDDTPGLLHRRFEPCLPELMAAADAVVCNAGYNTMRELEASGSPGVVVPLGTTGRDDQVRRARQLEAEGCALVCSPEPASLATAIARVLAGQGPARRDPLPGTDGIEMGRRLLGALSRS